jgi:hypothetical protein
MKLYELKEEIDNLIAEGHGDREVICSKDGEGNGYSPFYEFATGAWNEEWNEVGVDELTDELRSQGFTDDDVMEDGVPAIVIYPS